MPSEPEQSIRCPELELQVVHESPNKGAGSLIQVFCRAVGTPNFIFPTLASLFLINGSLPAGNSSTMIWPAYHTAYLRRMKNLVFILSIQPILRRDSTHLPTLYSSSCSLVVVPLTFTVWEPLSNLYWYLPISDSSEKQDLAKGCRDGSPVKICRYSSRGPKLSPAPTSNGSWLTVTPVPRSLCWDSARTHTHTM